MPGPTQYLYKIRPTRLEMLTQGPTSLEGEIPRDLELEEKLKQPDREAEREERGLFDQAAQRIKGMEFLIDQGKEEYNI